MNVMTYYISLRGGGGVWPVDTRAYYTGFGDNDASLRSVADIVTLQFLRKKYYTCVAIGRLYIYIYSDIVVRVCVLYAKQATNSGPGLHSNPALSS